MPLPTLGRTIMANTFNAIKAPTQPALEGLSKAACHRLQVRARINLEYDFGKELETALEHSPSAGGSTPGGATTFRR